MSNSFDLATGYVTFRGDMEKYDADIEAARKKVDALNDSLGNGRFRMAAGEAKRINDELAKAQRNAKRMMDEIQFGKMGVMFRDFNQGLNKFASMAGKFGAGATGIGGAALAAGAGGSPIAKSTLQGSFDLLMTEVGGTFTPLVKDASRGLQDLRKMWRGMSDEMKGFLNEGAKFIGIAGGLALAFAAVAKGMTLIMAHPLIATLAAGGAVLAAQESKLKGKDAEITDAKKSIYATTADDAAKGWQGQKLAGMQPDEAKGEAEKLFKQKWDTYEAERKRYEYLSTGAGSLLNSQDSIDKQAVRTTVAGKELEESKFNLNKYAGADLKKREGGKSGDDMLLGSMGPASMTDVQGLFRSFQMAGAGGNQLEAEQKRVEQENAQKLLGNSDKQVVLLEKIADNLPVRK